MMINEAGLLKNMTLLYVEDEEITRLEMKKFLKRRVGDLVIGQNGEEGLDLFLKHKPNIIISDLIMPKMGGHELLSQIRKHDLDCEFIITSALSDMDTVLTSIEQGICKYIIKPIDVDKLEKTLLSAAKRISQKKPEQFSEPLENKKELEDMIKNNVSHLIKKKSGKGPKNVSVSIKFKQVIIEAIEVLNAMEMNLLNTSGNHLLVNQNRIHFYELIKKDLKQIVEEIVEKEVISTVVEVDAKNNKDLIEISLY